jgi:DNA polymerase-3 subunit beta
MAQEIFSASVSSMRQALREMRNVIETRNSIPVLGYVRFERGEPVHMTGTNLDQWLTVYVDGRASEDFNAPFAALSKLLDGADCARVTAQIITPATDTQEGLVRWTVGDLTADFDMMPMRDMPVRDVAVVSYSPVAEIAVDVLLPTLDAVLHSVSSEETRYYLRGVNLCGEGKDNQFALVSTDGHRLTRVLLDKMTWEGSPIIFPQESVKTVRALAKAQKNGVVEIRRGKEHGLFIQGMGWHLATKTIDGTFPEYARIIPSWEKMTGQSKLDCAEIQAKTKRLLGVVGKGVGMLVDCEQGTLTTKSVDVKAVSVAVTVTPFVDAAPCRPFGVQPSYLIEAMGALKLFCDTAILSVAEEGDPMRLEPAIHPQDASVTVVVMPRRY